MAIPSFGPTGYATLAASGVSSNVALPTAGTPTVAVVENIGTYEVFVVLGASSVSVTPTTGMAIAPRESETLTIGTNTYLAAITVGGDSLVNITVGN